MIRVEEVVTKVCTMCLKAKPATPEFFAKGSYKRKTAIEKSLAPECKTCKNASARRSHARRMENPDYKEKRHTRYMREYNARRKAADPTWLKRTKKESYQRTFANSRDRQLQTTFGITEVQYQELHAQQGGVCAICAQPETTKPRKDSGKAPMLAVDHCHTSGKVRGLLCARCNQGLGNFKDNENSLIAAINYLKQSRS